jgi:hypothetical protein
MAPPQAAYSERSQGLPFPAAFLFGSEARSRRPLSLRNPDRRRHLRSDVLSGRPNLSTTERAVYIALGLGIAAAGAQPRPNPLLNVLASAVGSYLAWSGYQGHCALKAALIAGQKQLTPPSMNS